MVNNILVAGAVGLAGAAAAGASFRKFFIVQQLSLTEMIFRKNPPPLQARQAMGFRGKIGERSCFKCGRNEENNFDPRTGLLYQLQIVSISKNLSDDRPTNHYYSCLQCR